MSWKLDHTEFHYLTGTDLMIQMLRNKLVINPTDSVTVKHMDGVLEAIDEHMAANAQGLYYVRKMEHGVAMINPSQFVVYTENLIDREAIRELVDVTLASFMLSE